MAVISMKRAYFELISCVIFWGASFASMRMAVLELHPLTAVWFRVVFGLAVLAGIIFYRREFSMPKARELAPLLFLGLMGVVFHQDIQFAAMRTAGVANANWLIAATPSLIAVLGWVFLKERLQPQAIIGLVISGLGVLLVVGLGTKGIGMFQANSFGDLLIFISALNWAVFQIVSRKLVQDRTPAFTAFWMNVFAAIAQTSLFLFYPPEISQIASMSPSCWFAVLFLGCICSGLCYTFWYDGLSVMPAAKVAAFQFLQPVVGVVLAYFTAGERFTPYLFAGGVMIIAGVWMVNKDKRKAEAK
ncbi:membrane protein [Synergistales bacterium]|nr:membrane protein [Synergistales bacterium]